MNITIDRGIKAQYAAGCLRIASVALFVLSIAGAAAAQPAAPAEKWTTVYGAKIRYVEAGNGPVVILLHGLGGDASNWASTIAPLSQSSRVPGLDQIGFGKSDKPMINYRVATLVDFLDGFYKKVGVQKASLVGNSLGGFTAAAFALAHPEKVEKLGLVDAAGCSGGGGECAPRLGAAVSRSPRVEGKSRTNYIFFQ